MAITNEHFRLLARADQSAFLELPWGVPLEEWPAELLVDAKRGISRHVVRFVRLNGSFYALKDLPSRLAAREYRLLRALAALSVPPPLPALPPPPPPSPHPPLPPSSPTPP